jgi:hypothetical protein
LIRTVREWGDRLQECPDSLAGSIGSFGGPHDASRPHQGRWCFGKTPMQTFLDAMPMTKENMIAA